jgi:23S rRNA (uracil-5-)-methyltransferase RumA
MGDLQGGDELEVTIEDTAFPNLGVAYEDEAEIRIKNSWPGQQLKVRITKQKENFYQARKVEVLSSAPAERDDPLCEHLDLCGGCKQQLLTYPKQVELKKRQLQKMLAQAEIGDYQFLGVVPSPQSIEYRNKMEFSFGDLEKDGALQLGMHLPGKMYEVVTVDTCRLIDEDFRRVLETIINYFRETELKKYHFKLREGYLRHLLVRKGLRTGELLVNLVTTSGRDFDLSELTERLTNLDYKGELVGFLHTINDDYADAVKCDELQVEYGRNYYFEKLLDFKFKVSPFSFFQTNTYGAEELYRIVRDFLSQGQGKTVFDLFCGTGTISQVIAPQVEEVVGIELVEEAVEVARANRELNDLDNCRFIAGEVKAKLAELDKEPDTIILDPPRAGIHPEALKKIISYGCSEIIYVSCNPEALVEDLEEFVQAGYQVEKIKAVDMFPHTPHVESCVKLCRSS